MTFDNKPDKDNWTAHGIEDKFKKLDELNTRPFAPETSAQMRKS